MNLANNPKIPTPIAEDLVRVLTHFAEVRAILALIAMSRHWPEEGQAWGYLLDESTHDQLHNLVNPNECDTCHGTGRICVGTSGHDCDGNAMVFEACPECGLYPARVTNERRSECCQAAYKAGERQGRKDAEDIAKRAILLRDLLVNPNGS